MRRLQSLLGLAFFGLTSNIVPQARRNIFKQIHEIVFHGKGGYSWNDVYNMPIWLRRFTFKEIQNFYEKEHESASKSNKQDNNTLVDPSGKINKAQFASASPKMPSFKTKP
jgi:hypothetical protein